MLSVDVQLPETGIVLGGLKFWKFNVAWNVPDPCGDPDEIATVPVQSPLPVRVVS
jgi:hypothetical protein